MIDPVLAAMDRELAEPIVLHDCRGGIFADFLRSLARPFWGHLIREGWDRLEGRENPERTALLRGDAS